MTGAGTPAIGPPTADLIVVGAGPAGRALAHRALVHGLDVIVVDPAPDRPWTATFGMFDDDLPSWLDRDVIACGAPDFVVYTPQRRAVGRGYSVLAPRALQRSLTVAGARTEVCRAAEVTAHTVRLDDGRLLAAGHVIDARGPRSLDPAIPRQRAYGTFHRTEPRAPEMVLMDWRSTTTADPTFSYRVDLGDGVRLVEETCLAGRPATTLGTLAERNVHRTDAPATGRSPEEVDFGLYPDTAPWRGRGALRFGAAGGQMHPATGYSIAASLNAADRLAAAIARGEDPAAALWDRAARWTYRLRLLGLAVLLGFDGRALCAFFDVFFRLPVPRQRAYLNGAGDLRGTAATMWAVFRGLGWPLRRRLIVATVRAAPRVVRGRPRERPRAY